MKEEIVMNDYNSILFIITMIILFISAPYFLSYMFFFITSVLSGNEFIKTFKFSFIAPFIDKTSRAIFIFITLILLNLLCLSIFSMYM